MIAYHADAFVLPLPPGHTFPMSKYRLLREAVERELPAIRVTEAPPASDGELALAHTPRWIQAVAEGLTSDTEQREIGFPWSQRLRTRHGGDADVSLPAVEQPRWFRTQRRSARLR